MGYSHGIKWNKDLIKRELDTIVTKFNLKVFPTAKQINYLRDSQDLSNAISKNGGFNFWAKELNLPIGQSDTNFGQEYEEICFNSLSAMGYEIKRMSTKFPYDLTANKHIKIDVKAGRLFSNSKNGNFYTFNLEKKYPTCDIFICYCINKENKIEKTYIIPSKKMYGKIQLSIGQISSVYDNYKNNWEILKTYDSFYKQI